MKYKTLLLDADETLLDFSKTESAAIQKTFEIHKLYFDNEIRSLYSTINRQCWKEFEQGLMTKQTLLLERFRRLFEKLKIDADPKSVEVTYQRELGEGAYLIDGVYELCQELSRHCDLYIVTNGVSSTQYRRMEKSGLSSLIKNMFVSEDVGYQKPQKEYFSYVFDHIPDFDLSAALMVGDSLTADISGALAMGLDTCWYNPKGLSAPENMKITYIISKITDLKTIVQ